MKNRLMSGAQRARHVFAAAALIAIATPALAAPKSPTYPEALEKAISKNWAPPGSAADATVCRVTIRQLPGGDVLSARVEAPCAADAGLSASLELAVMRATPLPFFGHESEFDGVMRVDVRVGDVDSRTSRTFRSR